MNIRDKYRISDGTRSAIMILADNGIVVDPIYDNFTPTVFQKWSGKLDAFGNDVFEGDQVSERIWGKCLVVRNQSDEF